MLPGKRAVLFLISFILFFAFNVHAKDALMIATDDWPPYEYAENGEIVGFSTDTVKAVLKTMKVQITTLRIYPWVRAEKLAFDGDVDMIFTASKSDKRMMYCHFPDEPLIISPNLMFIRKADAGRLKFDAFSDLKGHRVGIVREYAYTKAFLDYLKKEGIQTLIALDDAMNFKMLMRGMVDYIPADLGNSQGIIQKANLHGKLHAFRHNPIKTAGLYALFSKKRVDPAFVKEFSSALKAFKSTEQYRNIYQSYFPEQ